MHTENGAPEAQTIDGLFTGTRKQQLHGPQDRRLVLQSKHWSKAKREDLESMLQGESVRTGIIYDQSKGHYYSAGPEDTWLRVTEGMAKNRLAVHQKASTVPATRGEVSAVDQAMDVIVHYANVDQVTALAGYSKGVYAFSDGRILVPKSPNVIEGKEGTWTFIDRFLTEFFGQEQLPYFLGWLSWARISFINGSLAPGQACVCAGPHGCGKNALNDLIVTPVFGGRSANPFQYMVGQTAFNAELAKAEHLIISDQPATRSYQDREMFGTRIKDLCVNRQQRIHSKGKDAFHAELFWRISIALNHDDASMEILPPFDPAILEKMMLFLVGAPSVLPADNKPSTQSEFAARIRRELPGFIYYLENVHKIPEELSDGRFGIRAYHNPRFLSQAADTSPEGALLAMMERAGITEEYDGSELGNGGKLMDLEAAAIFEKLMKNQATEIEAKKTLHNVNQVARYLTRLSERPNPRVNVRPGRARSRFFSFTPLSNRDD
jgi:hypothetical protein